MEELKCKVANKCGGCQLQGIPYEEQLKRKQQHVKEVLGKYGKINKIVGMEHPYHYRNKVHAAFDRDRRGAIISGIYKAGTHILMPVDECMIEDQKAGEIIRTIRGMLKSFKIKTYDEDTGYGLLRHVLVRKGFASGEIMVVLVLGSPILPSKNNFVKALLKVHPEITTIILNVNDKKTSMILGEKEKTIYGKGYIVDTLCGFTFRISSKSFYQVNPIQTEVLYKKAIEYAGLTGKERIIDAYCGIGTIGMVASKHAKEVIGVELSREAVRDARANAKQNGCKNMQFYQADAGVFMVSLAEQNEKIDVVFMDPPRSGSDEAFLSSVVQLKPKKVVYVSCNPETLARDLEYLVTKGYKVQEMQPVDMFSWTEHVECVVLMTKNK
ncbi:MAG: 23S rRNA (uracil(1939)-C(5))-methyltransferase RlmD [Lachnospiraceae bacterium]